MSGSGMEGSDYAPSKQQRGGSDDGDNSNNSNQRKGAGGGRSNNNNSNNGSRTEYRFLVPSRDAGGIIGKQGKTIQELRQKHRCQIQMADCDAPERVLVIGGEQSDVLNCMSDILSAIVENHQRNTAKPEQSEVRALVHQSQAGALIGKGASRVKEFREKHNIDVKVYPQCCPGGSTERCISMRGNKDDVMGCLTEVYEILDSVPPRGPYRVYDPSSYDGFSVGDYGGFSDSPSGGSSSGGQQGRAGGYSNPYGPPSSNTYGPPPPHYSYGDDSYNRRGGGTAYEPPNASGPVTTTQVTVPTSLAGIIIGAKGSKISQIRQESGASIKIDSEPLKDSNDRLITITGSQDQIQQAQFLLQQTIRQSGMWNQ